MSSAIVLTKIVPATNTIDVKGVYLFPKRRDAAEHAVTIACDLGFTDDPILEDYTDEMLNEFLEIATENLKQGHTLCIPDVTGKEVMQIQVVKVTGFSKSKTLKKSLNILDLVRPTLN